MLNRLNDITDLLRISGPLIEIKCAPDSPATAFAIRVFPVPEGPCSRIPRGGGMPEINNTCNNDKSYTKIARLWRK